MSSYCSRTATETASSIAVSAGIAARSARSASGSRTCWSSSARRGGGHVRCSSACAEGRVCRGSYAPSAATRRGGMAEPDATAALMAVRKCWTPEHSSSRIANTYSLMKHWRASAQKNVIASSSADGPSGEVAPSSNTERAAVRKRSSAMSRTGADSSSARRSGSRATAASPSLPQSSRCESPAGHAATARATAAPAAPCLKISAASGASSLGRLQPSVSARAMRAASSASASLARMCFTHCTKNARASSVSPTASPRRASASACAASPCVNSMRPKFR